MSDWESFATEEEAVWYVWTDVRDEGYKEQGGPYLTKFNIYGKSFYMKGDGRETNIKYIVQCGEKYAELEDLNPTKEVCKCIR